MLDAILFQRYENRISPPLGQVGKGDHQKMSELDTKAID
jgi:hypothetical protein